MQDLLKILVEHLLSWPIAVLLLCLLFRKPLTNLVNRIDLFKGPGIEVSTPVVSASKQLEKEGPSSNSELTLPLKEQTSLPLSDELEQRRRAVLAYGGEEEILLLQMKEIEENLKALQFSLNSEETSRLLIRHLAVTQILHKAEQTYRLIFGSQIALMRYLNESGPQPEPTVQSFFERAKAESPRFYVDYTFDDWISFLISQQTVILENGLYEISIFGRQFLGWLVATAVPAKSF